MDEIACFDGYGHKVTETTPTRMDRVAAERSDQEREEHYRARYDGDDGCGPYLSWYFEIDHIQNMIREWWLDFDYWAYNNLGQGYSLACNDGWFVDPRTSAAWKGFVQGRLLGEKSHPSPDSPSLDSPPD